MVLTDPGFRFLDISLVNSLETYILGIFLLDIISQFITVRYIYLDILFRYLIGDQFIRYLYSFMFHVIGPGHLARCLDIPMEGKQFAAVSSHSDAARVMRWRCIRITRLHE